MTIDKHTLDKAKKWAGEILDRARPHQYADTAIAAAEVVRDLPAAIVDGDKVREVINEVLASYQHGTVGHHVAEELACKLQALLPDPQPQVEIALGAWAMHPEHGKVLISSDKADSAGDVRVHVKDSSSAVGTAPVWVTAADLSPLPDTQGDSDSGQGPNRQGTLNNSPEPQPGEAWEVAVDDEKFNAIVSGAGYLYVDTVRTWTPAHSVTPLRRLVPAQEPRVLTTVEDYENAAVGTIAQRDNGITREKVGADEWGVAGAIKLHSNKEMALRPRTVLWEPEA